MMYFLDFEATQYGGIIISVGIASEEYTYYSLVKPVNKEKITSFITNLTGITNEMVATAPPVEHVFATIRQHVHPIKDDDYFFVYGDCDVKFIRNTAKHIKSELIRDFMIDMSNHVVDFHKIAKNYFHTNSISLKNAVATVRSGEVIQVHNSLEDSLLLQELYMNVANSLDIQYEIEELKKQEVNRSTYKNTTTKKKKKFKDPLDNKYGALNGTIVVTKPKEPRFRPREHVCWSSIMHFYRTHKKLSSKTRNMSNDCLHSAILDAMERKVTLYGYFFEYVPNN